LYPIYEEEKKMAILKGFPPSNTISPTTRVPTTEGESVVIDTRDPWKMGRVMLSFGSWAMPLQGENIPPCGFKVKWCAYKGDKKIYYYL
jgi:hypothetical protein